MAERKGGIRGFRAGVFRDPCTVWMMPLTLNLCRVESKQREAVSAKKRCRWKKKLNRPTERTTKIIDHPTPP